MRMVKPKAPSRKRKGISMELKLSKCWLNPRKAETTQAKKKAAVSSLNRTSKMLFRLFHPPRVHTNPKIAIPKVNQRQGCEKAMDKMDQLFAGNSGS